MPWWVGTSFFIYCMHRELVAVFGKLLYLALPKSGGFILLVYPLASAVTVIFCIFVFYIGRRLLPSVTRVLNGGRLPLREADNLTYNGGT